MTAMTKPLGDVYFHCLLNRVLFQCSVREFTAYREFGSHKAFSYGENLTKVALVPSKQARKQALTGNDLNCTPAELD